MQHVADLRTGIQQHREGSFTSDEGLIEAGRRAPGPRASGPPPARPVHEPFQEPFPPAHRDGRAASGRRNLTRGRHLEMPQVVRPGAERAGRSRAAAVVHPGLPGTARSDAWRSRKPRPARYPPPAPWAQAGPGPANAIASWSLAVFAVPANRATRLIRQAGTQMPGTSRPRQGRRCRVPCPGTAHQGTRPPGRAGHARPPRHHPKGRYCPPR